MDSKEPGGDAFMEFKELLQSTSVMGLMLLVFIIFVLNGDYTYPHNLDTPIRWTISPLSE